jgi:SSS family solute:Na+ symporter
VWIYLSGLMLLALYLNSKQASAEDYFLGNHRLSASTLAASTIATQCSTNSLLGAPAFVGFVAGGGMIWLQYELAVPLAMLALLWIMLPARRYGVTSIYEILELRIGRRARLTAAGCFLLFRGVATAVTLYGSALVVSLLLELHFVAAVLLIMTATVLYDYFGGLTAVVISDAIQLALLLGAVLFSLIYIGDLIDWDFFVEERKQTLVNDWGFGGQDYGFWPMLIGGVFLYASYYGCDQSQAQRILAARSEADTARVLLWNGVFRFPIVLLYCFLGLGLAALAAQDPRILGSLPTTSGGEATFARQGLHYGVGTVRGGLRFSGRKHCSNGFGSREQSGVHGQRPITRPHRVSDTDAARIPDQRTGWLCWWATSQSTGRRVLT